MVAEVCKGRKEGREVLLRESEKSLLFWLSRHIYHNSLFSGWRVIMSVPTCQESLMNHVESGEAYIFLKYFIVDRLMCYQ